MTALDDPLAVQVPKAARAIGLGPTKTWELVRSGQLRSFRVGRRVLVTRQAIVDFIAARDLGDEQRAAV